VSTPPTLGASSSSLDTLFEPKSIAVIGASSDQRRFGGRPIQYLIESGFAGPVYPVNPSRSEIQGLKSYASIADVEGGVDCALLAVGADATLGAVEACIAKGVKAAILFGAGFAEVGGDGQVRQDEVVAAARAGGLRLLGPNCMGLVNTRAGFYGTFASAFEDGLPPPGRIAIASQSGGYGGYLMKHLFLRGLGLSQWATTGNEADIDVGEALMWMAASADSDILLAYVEGLRASDKFIAALDLARRSHKPVVIMKVGRTAEGVAAAASHTAALTGEDRIYDALFDAYGVHRARTTEELLDIAYALSKKRTLRGPRVGVISISGGVGVQIADFVADAGLKMGVVPDAVQARLTALVPHCSPRNPIDMTGLMSTNHDIMESTLDAVLGSGAFDATLVFLGIAGAAPSMAGPLQQAIANAYARHPDQLAVVSVTADRDMVRAYDRQGVLTFEDPSRAITALAALNRFRETFEGDWTAPSDGAPISAPLLAGGPLNETEAKALLARCGVPGPREALAKTPEEAARRAAEIGFPVALKIVSPDIPHKTEYGGVALGLASPQEVEAAARRMAETIPERLPAARLDGYLVSEMVADGVECIVGVHRDPVFGPVVTFGLGGTLVELLRDTACALAPISEAGALKGLRGLKTFALLDGYRGGPRYDIDALALAIARISRLAVENADRLSAIEVNPLLVRPGRGGVVALDAVVTTVQRRSL
jgi:acetate---CoA ligase (ADP-forming)